MQHNCSSHHLDPPCLCHFRSTGCRARPQAPELAAMLLSRERTRAVEDLSFSDGLSLQCAMNLKHVGAIWCSAHECCSKSRLRESRSCGSGVWCMPSRRCISSRCECGAALSMYLCWSTHVGIQIYMHTCVCLRTQRCKDVCVCVCLVYKLAMIRQIAIFMYVCVYDVYMQAHQDASPSVCLYAS